MKRLLLPGPIFYESFQRYRRGGLGECGESGSDEAGGEKQRGRAEGVHAVHSGLREETAQV
jgi:hypothetical protein